jgi:hypothetical protein
VLRSLRLVAVVSLVASALLAGAHAAAQISRPQAGAATAAWTPEQISGVLERTQTIHLAPDISHFSKGERLAMGS